MSEQRRTDQRETGQRETGQQETAQQRTEEHAAPGAGGGDLSRVRGKAPVAQVLCAALGLVLLALGVIGLAQLGVDDMGGTPAGAQGAVWGLGGSPLLNLAHTGLGVLLLLASTRNNGARVAGMVGGLIFTGLLAYDVVALIVRAPGDPFGSRAGTLVVHAVALLATALIASLAGRAAPAHQRGR